jgi:hypothetical protein
MGDVRYHGDNRDLVLRFVLYTAWAHRCYWCREPKPFTDIEIDHILPKNLKADRVGQHIKTHSLHSDFHVHDPANLAPICHRCNGPGYKGPIDYDQNGLIQSHLDKARGLRSKVIEGTAQFHSSGKVSKALLLASTVPLDDEAVVHALGEYGPAVVQRLADIDVAEADYLTYAGLAAAGGPRPRARRPALDVRRSRLHRDARARPQDHAGDRRTTSL